MKLQNLITKIHFTWLHKNKNSFTIMVLGECFRTNTSHISILLLSFRSWQQLNSKYCCMVREKIIVSTICIRDANKQNVMLASTINAGNELNRLRYFFKKKKNIFPKLGFKSCGSEFQDNFNLDTYLTATV